MTECNKNNKCCKKEDDQAKSVFRKRIVDGLYQKHCGIRDLTIARITQNLEYPATADIDAIDTLIQDLASANQTISLIEHMFSDAEVEPSKEEVES